MSALTHSGLNGCSVWTRLRLNSLCLDGLIAVRVTNGFQPPRLCVGGKEPAAKCNEIVTDVVL